MDPRLRSLNTFWLMLIVLNPFATKLLTSHGGVDIIVHAFRFGFYALVQGLISTVMILMLRRMSTHDQAPGLPTQASAATGWQSYGLAIGFGLSIPFFFVTGYAWVFWFAVPMVAIRIYHRRRRNRGGPPEPASDPAAP